MSQGGGESEGQKPITSSSLPSASPQAVLNIRTPFQIFKGEGRQGNAAEFSSLPNEVMLPYKILSSEMLLQAALNYIENNTQMTRFYGPSTLRITEGYLSDLLSFIPLGARSNDARKVSVNYKAIERVAALYDTSDSVKQIIAQISEENLPADEVSTKSIASIMESFGIMEKSLRQKMRESGEKVGLFHRSTAVAPQPERGESEATGDDHTPLISQTALGKRVSRARSEAAVADAGVLLGKDEEQSEMPRPQKMRRVEVKKEPGSVAKKKAPQMLLQSSVFGRLRALSSAEKKVVNLLNQLIQLVGHVHAVRYNNLLPIFEFLQEQVTQVQTMIDTERAAFRAATKEGEATQEPFLMVSLDGILQAIYNSSQTFKTDENCRYELDSDLLHPIAHACLTEINRIEGFTTAQFVGPSEAELAAKAKAHEAAREKRDEQRAKLLERARVREELLAKREEERQLVRAQLGELNPESLVEDTSIKNPVSSGYVHYGDLPLEESNHYERALFIWAMMTSLPKPLQLSQMPFSFFLKGLTSDEGRGNGLMEEVVTALLEVALTALRNSNELQTFRKGRDWFDNMVEFVVVTSGNKKKPVPRASSRRKSDDESDDEEDDDDDDDDEEEEEEEEEEDQDDDNIEENEGVEVGAASVSSTATEEENEKLEMEAEDGAAVGSMGAAIKSTLQNLAELRSLAAWGNIGMNDRLNLLHYLVAEVLSSPAVREEAEKLRKLQEEVQSTMEKRTKELREEAEKKIKLLVKQFSSSVSTNQVTETYEQTREKLLSEIQQRLQDVVRENVGMQDGKDIGAIIRPLGMDRYRRLYWRFPFDSNILVQTTAATDPTFPILCKPQALKQKDPQKSEEKLLEDENEDVETRRIRSDDNARVEENDVQRVWGTVPPADLEQFIGGLDRRGKREAALRCAIEAIQPYLMNMPEQPQGGRVTRTRSHAFGYLNRLKLEL